MPVIILLAICLFLPNVNLGAEAFRTTVEGSLEVSPSSADGSVSIGINSSVLITLGAEARFLRGIEVEITAPQNWLQYRNSLVMMIYSNLIPQTASGVADLDGRRVIFDTLPSRLRIVYHIPLRTQHGLRTTTSVTVLSSVIQPTTFPILFRLSPINKGLNDDFELLRFNLVARPILSDEGAVRIIPRFPPQLRNRPFTLLIDDNVISNINEQILLRAGEHHLVITSEDYRNESRRFVVERARVLELTVELHDPTPIIIFEAPQNAQIFLDNAPIARNRESVTVEPGTHEVRFQVGDYTVIRTLNVQRGKT